MTATLTSIRWRRHFGHKQSFAFPKCRMKCVRLQLMPPANYNTTHYLQCNSGPEAVHLLAYKEKRLGGRVQLLLPSSYFLKNFYLFLSFRGERIPVYHVMFI